MLNNITQKYHANIKCDCGHLQKDHYHKEGYCCKCGCTWFYPNIKYIKIKNTIK